MKHCLKLFLSIAALTVAACKKTDLHPSPINTGEKTPQWRLFNSTNSSLPDQQVNSIVITKNDVKWIGTANGLARFEGSTWTVYNTANSALPSNFVQALAVQDNGTVWIGTNKGLARFDGKSWSVFTQENSLLPSRAVMSLAHDEAYNRVWVGTEQGILKIDAAGKWELYGETDGELPLSMATDQDGALWIGAHEHVSFRGKIKKFYNGVWKSYQLAPMGYESAFPYAIGVARNNSVVALLAGTAVKTVIKFSAGSWQELSQPEGAYGIRAMLLQGDQVWVGGLGLSKFGDAKATVLNLPNNSSGILSMAIDSKGDKWLGTTRGGVVVYHENN